ncbi:MAG: MgtC/SapB family protein, partial [Sulfitobacter sp.]
MFESLLADLTNSFSKVPVTVAAARLLMAAFLAGVVGFERERRDKPAGLRTHIMVAIAACLFIIIGQELGSLE